MYNYICFFKAINVGKTRRIKMAELKGIFIKLGYTNFYSYIQSGNIYFTSSTQLDNNVLIEQLNSLLPFTVELLLFNTTEYLDIVNNIPCSDPTTTHLTFIQDKHTNIESIIIDNNPETIILGNHVIYLSCGDKYSDSKYSNAYIENKLKTIATTRNYKTVIKMNEYVKAQS